MSLGHGLSKSARLNRITLLAIGLLFPLASCQKSESSIEPQTRTEILVSENVSGKVKICSFNIQFLGASYVRDTHALAQIVRRAGCDMVLVQELIAPPDVRRLSSSKYYGRAEMPNYPGTNIPWKENDRSTRFFLDMIDAGFDQMEMSEEDTGRGAQDYHNSTAAEWWVAFYKSSKFETQERLANGFVAAPITQNPTWNRVPYAFSFRCKSKEDLEPKTDFTLISAHLHTGPGRANALKRQVELSGLYSWVNAQERNNTERDYFIVGDLNIENKQELIDATKKANYISLNTQAGFATNTNINGPKPYDHVLYRPSETAEVLPLQNFEVINLVNLAKNYWSMSDPAYPGTPYTHNQFRMYYSDHHPVAFTLNCLPDDD